MKNGHEARMSDAPEVTTVVKAIQQVLVRHGQPSAWELLDALANKLGLKVRWVVREAAERLLDDSSMTRAQREYLRSLLESEDLEKAIRGTEKPASDIQSTIDGLLQASSAYRNSASFQEMVSFIANFREYAPFNNMLVKLQNPSCSFFATQKDWRTKFGRRLKKDARPMLILAPMHPVLLVYDLDSTEGPPPPQELRHFAKFEGEWERGRLDRTERNATFRDLIFIDTVTLSSTHAGFAMISPGINDTKMRIGLHVELDAPSRYGVLLHELAHIYLGHLGGDADLWWPSRCDLPRRAMEVEAEAVAYIVSRRAGLQGSSSQYVSRYLDGEITLKKVSLDLIAKVAGQLEQMGTKALKKRKTRRSPQETMERTSRR